MVKPLLYFWKKIKMLFRLHTDFCVNNSLLFSESLRKQVRKSVGVKAKVKGSGKPELWSIWHQESQFLGKIQEDPGGRDIFSAIKGCLETPTFMLREDVPFSVLTWSFLSDQKFESHPDWLKSTSNGLHFQRALPFKICTLVYQTVHFPFPYWELLK